MLVVSPDFSSRTTGSLFPTCRQVGGYFFADQKSDGILDWDFVWKWWKVFTFI